MTTDRWIAVISLAVTSIGIPIAILVSRYYYRRSDKKRAPTFVIQNRTALSGPELAKVGNLAIMCSEREVGKDGITQAKIYFWNSGSQAVQANDVLEEHTLSLSVPILSYAISKVSREITQLSIQRKTDKQLVVTFSVLESGDGCTLTIVYDGPPTAGIEFNGACLDSAKPMVLPPDDFYSVPRSKRLLHAYGPILGLPIAIVGVGLAVGGILIGGTATVWWGLKKLLGEHSAQTAFGYIVGAVVVILFLMTIVAAAWPKIRRVGSPFLPPDVKG